MVVDRPPVNKMHTKYYFPRHARFGRRPSRCIPYRRYTSAPSPSRRTCNGKRRPSRGPTPTISPHTRLAVRMLHGYVPDPNNSYWTHTCVIEVHERACSVLPFVTAKQTGLSEHRHPQLSHLRLFGDHASSTLVSAPTRMSRVSDRLDGGPRTLNIVGKRKTCIHQ